jgi:hypothetical protein
MKIIDRSGANLYEHIDKMRVMPAMWLGEATITALKRFIDAYQFALEQHGIEEQLDPPFHEFHDFCAKYFQAAAEAGWCRIILSDHYGQEEEALAHFFALFDDFRERTDVMKGRRVMTALAREVYFNQSHWRERLRDFDSALALIRQPLCASYRARIAHEYDAALREIEAIAERNADVRLLLQAARGASQP